MKATSTLPLEFNPVQDDLDERKELRDGLSAVLQIGNTLWLANDESASVERLTLGGGDRGSGVRADGHTQFLLSDYLALPLKPTGTPPETPEVDVEGLDHAGGYLWVAGSHSLKRSKPPADAGVKAAQKKLGEVSADGNRYLLARIPMVRRGGTWTLAKTHTHRGIERTAALLRGDAKGNELTRALRKDKHLGAFMGIPGKDNGFDIEGLAVVGERVFLGLRGPVLRGWAVILEVALQDDKSRAGTLRLKPMDGKGRLLRKHFVALGGLGVRDIRAQGADLLILAGPTMDLDGPVTVWRWPGGARCDGPRMVAAGELVRVMDLPFGKGCDHPEGMALFTAGDSMKESLLVVVDAASEQRQRGESTLLADIFELPPNA